MSVSVALQDLIISSLTTDATVSSFVGNRVWDHPPANPQFPYITIGATDFTPEDADCIHMREETTQIDIWSRDNGKKWPCKQILDAAVNVLRDLDGDLTDGALIATRVDIARVFNDPDGLTTHGVVQVTVTIEG